jgi:hypothetical protein
LKSSSCAPGIGGQLFSTAEPSGEDGLRALLLPHEQESAVGTNPRGGGQ